MTLKCENISKLYGDTAALSHVELELGRGIYGLLGPNGAGKTTLMRIMTDLLEPSAGRVTLDGVDISSPVGTQVAAVAAGTVASVEQDDLMGTTVTISHGGGVESIYANLAAQPAVEAGDTVKAGDVIGAVGETAIAESARLPHLHLEMRVDGESVDPLNYLPEQ